VDLDKVEHNARTIVEMCTRHGIRVTGVTKGLCGDPEVARAMLRGGVDSIGESRLENIERLRAGGVDAPVLLLRIPSRSHVERAVELAVASCNSELEVVEALAAAARRSARRHGVIVMVDLGDLREGVWPDRAVEVAGRIGGLDGVHVAGLGANLACFGGVVPTVENMAGLVDLAEQVESALGERLGCISAGNSSALTLVAVGAMPARVDHLRIGEAILLGRETIERRPWPGTYQDAVVLHGEVLELARKPSTPVGQRGQDAMGHRPDFVDRGWVDHALVNLGTVDTDVAGLTPVDDRLVVLGGSSDYVVLDVSGAHGELRVGDDVAFFPGYGAMVTAASSPYVQIRHHPPGRERGIRRG
jgi:predicted amino acid racemase